MSKAVFETLATRQAQGAMFHSEMADYYGFLNLTDLEQFHHCQFMKESGTFRDIKMFYIGHCHKTLRLESIEPLPKVVPADWDNRTSMDIDKETIKILTKKSLIMYMDWENETCEIFKQCANDLFEEEYYEGYKFVRKLIDDVELEKTHISSLMLDLQSVDYDINAIKGLSYKMKW